MVKHVETESCGRYENDRAEFLSFFIYGTVRSNVKVGLIESEETFFRVFFFRYKNVLIAQYGSINTLKNYIQCYKPIALVAAC